ncbi:MAG: hypothetical protein WC890_05570 [Candidatus Margulisiibacteriota bacterium]
MTVTKVSRPGGLKAVLNFDKVQNLQKYAHLVGSNFIKTQIKLIKGRETDWSMARTRVNGSIETALPRELGQLIRGVEKNRPCLFDDPAICSSLLRGIFDGIYQSDLPENLLSPKYDKERFVGEVAVWLLSYNGECPKIKFDQIVAEMYHFHERIAAAGKTVFIESVCQTATKNCSAGGEGDLLGKLFDSQDLVTGNIDALENQLEQKFGLICRMLEAIVGRI